MTKSAKRIDFSGRCKEILDVLEKPWPGAEPYADEREIRIQVMQEIEEQNSLTMHYARQLGLITAEDEVPFVRRPMPAGCDPDEWEREMVISEHRHHDMLQNSFLDRPGMWDLVWSTHPGADRVCEDDHISGAPEDYDDDVINAKMIALEVADGKGKTKKRAGRKLGR
jgi:hypothetical protein